MSGFDYGAEPVASSGGFKQPTAGAHKALVRSIVHLGVCTEYFNGKAKDPAPQVVVVFELQNKDDFEDDGVTPLTFSKSFALRQGSKAFLTKFQQVMDKQGEASGFDDYIGRHCNIVLKDSDKLDDNGKPKYVNFDSISEVHPELVETMKPLAGLGVGHVRFADMTTEALLELHPIRDIAELMMKGVEYNGSKAQELIAAIRKDNPTFAVRSQSNGSQNEAQGDSDAPSNTPSAPAQPPAQLDEDEEF